MEPYPYPKDLTEEQKEYQTNPDPQVVGRIADQVSLVWEWGAELVHSSVTEWLKTMAREESKWGKYYSDLMSEAKTADSSAPTPLSDGGDFLPPGEEGRALGMYQPWPDKTLNKLINSAAHWDGRSWDRRLDYFKNSWRPGGKDFVRKKILQSMNDGHGIKRATQELRAALPDKLKDKAGVVVRTESQRVSSRVHEIQMAQDARDGIVAGKMYTAALDDRTCMACAQFDGQKFAVTGRQTPEWFSMEEEGSGGGPDLYPEFSSADEANDWIIQNTDLDDVDITDMDRESAQTIAHEITRLDRKYGGLQTDVRSSSLSGSGPVKVRQLKTKEMSSIANSSIYINPKYTNSKIARSGQDIYKGKESWKHVIDHEVGHKRLGYLEYNMDMNNKVQEFIKNNRGHLSNRFESYYLGSTSEFLAESWARRENEILDPKIKEFIDSIVGEGEW